MNHQHDFSSIDRLIDLGMGIAMSNQIAQSMNNMMAQISTPPQINQAYTGYAQRPDLNINNQRPAVLAQQAAITTPVQTTITAQTSAAAQVQSEKTVEVGQEFYYALVNGKQLGPYKGTEIALLIIGKKVIADTLVWKTGTKDWVKASEYEDLKNLIDLVPPELKDIQG